MDPRYQLYLLVRENASSDTIRELLRELPHVDIIDRTATDLLQVAADSTLDNLMVVRELINAGADINLANVNGLTPLHCAVLRRKRSVVIALIESGANINAESTEKRTPLHFAISNDEYYKPKRLSLFHRPGPDIRIVEKLLEQENLLINKRDIYGNTPLIWAVGYKQLNSVLLLLEKGANPHICNKFRANPLHIALYDKEPSLAILVQLLTHRANINCADIKGKTPVDFLIQNIRNAQSVQVAYTCLKVVALHYRITKPLILKLQSNLHLWSYLKNCYDHVRRMRSDVISNRMTVYDFVMKRFNQLDFDNPVIQVYKPIVDKLLKGLYLKYLNLVLLRVSKSNLFAVLDITLFKYCEKTPKGEETIDIVDHKELSDVKYRQEITDTLVCEKRTDVEECNKFSHSKDCNNTPDEKDFKHTPMKRTARLCPKKRTARIRPMKRTARIRPMKRTARIRSMKRIARIRQMKRAARIRPMQKKCKDTTSAKYCPKVNLTNFFLIINLLSEYFSSLDVFHLIAAFSNAKVSELSKNNYN